MYNLKFNFHKLIEFNWIIFKLFNKFMELVSIEQKFEIKNMNIKKLILKFGFL